MQGNPTPSARKDQICALYKDGHTTKWITLALHSSPCTILKVLREMGIPTRHSHHPSVALVCKECGVTFTRPVSQVTETEYHFCSRQCYQKHQTTGTSSEAIANHKRISCEWKAAHKEHVRAYQREYYHRTHPGRKPKGISTLTCAACGVVFQRQTCKVKPFDRHFCSHECFSKAITTGESLEAAERRRVAMQTWRTEHKEEVQNKARVHYQKHKEEVKQKVAEWCRANPDKARATKKRYKARARNNAMTLSDEELRRVMSTGCWFCGATEDLEAAHNVPVVRGGGFTQENIFCLCRSCNAQMGTLTLIQVLEKRPYLIRDMDRFNSLRITNGAVVIAEVIA